MIFHGVPLRTAPMPSYITQELIAMILLVSSAKNAIVFNVELFSILAFPAKNIRLKQTQTKMKRPFKTL